MSHPRRTELPKKDFRWNNGVLEQKIRIIQHHSTESQVVGLYIEWHPVTVNGELITK